MAVLWLCFLTEIDSNTYQVPEELEENPEINKALEELKVTAFTEEELRAYDKFWDDVRVERILVYDNFQKGFKEGIEKGETRKSLAIAKNFLSLGMLPEQVAKGTQLPLNVILSLADEK